MLGANEKEIQVVVRNFPYILDRAIEDWAKFKVGAKAGLFEVSSIARRDKQEILEWFAGFPRLWETVRPNFVMTPGGLLITHVSDVVAKADRFVEKLAAYPSNKQLGIAPLIIAGVLIAGALGLSGVFWAIGYVKKQRNVSNLIDGVVAGKISPDILEQAIRAEQSVGIFGDIGSLLKVILVGGVVLMIVPLLGIRRKR